MTYTIQESETLLARLSAAKGDVPHNITVTPEIFQRLGFGCHRLKLVASNMVTKPPMSVHLQVPTLHQPSAPGFIQCSISYKYQSAFFGNKLNIKNVNKTMFGFLYRSGTVDQFDMDHL